MTSMISLPRRWRTVALAVVVAGTLGTTCEEDPAPPFVVSGEGAVEGLLFYDADRNQAFDPSAGDSAVPGVTVLVRERGTQSTLSGGQAVTDAAGRFSIGMLPPGTHDLFIDTATVGAGVEFCQNPVPVTVRIDLVAFAPVAGRLGCVILIAQAESLGVGPPVPYVTIQGIVTAAPGQLRSGMDNAYIEDQSGGVQVFGSALAGLGIAVGDRIEVSGSMTQFGGEYEVSDGLAGPLVVNAIVPNVTVPQPADVMTVTAAAAGSPGAMLQGMLVRVMKAMQMTPFQTGGGRNGVFDDSSGPVEVRIESGVLADTTQIDTQFPGGKCYDITGVLGSFGGTAQIKPRTLADLLEVPC